MYYSGYTTAERRFDSEMTPKKHPEGPLLLDGGLATELEARGFDLKHKLWSAKILLEYPQAIIDAHLAYLRAGAQCIISASYQVSVPGFLQLGLSRQQAEDTLKLSVELAQQAVEQFCDQSEPATRPRVAASVGPYGAFLADGSEYHGNYGVPEQELLEFHRQRLEILSATGADYLACETIPSMPEARVLNSLLAGQDKPAWVSFSCRDGAHMNDGHLLSEAGELFKDNPVVFALGINCTSPEHINPLIDTLKAHTQKDIVVYPNSGECFHADTKTWHGTADPAECATAALGWRTHGATIIGGCCRMGPEHIRAIGTALTGP
jgi:homocysteine S-methyltransferase